MDPREGMKLRLGYEVAREIERTPVIAPGVSDAAVRAINSVLYQRLQDQITEDNPTTRILEERIRDINITNISSESNINKQDLIAVLQSGGFQGPPGDKGDKGDDAPPLHHRLDLAGRQGLVDHQGGQLLWTKHRNLPNARLRTIHHRLHQK